VLAGSSVLVAATVASWLVLVTLAGLRLAGFPIGPVAQVVCGALAAPIAAASAIGAAFAISRGPRVVSFERTEAVMCKPSEAQAIRDAAQLRGTMGGAGHVYPARLAFPIAAWLGAALSGTEVVSAGMLRVAGAWPIGLALCAAFAALLFPARPFWYREVTGGGVLVTPPAAAALVTAHAFRLEPAAEGAESDRHRAASERRHER
jgi:hypothetical protein